MINLLADNRKSEIIAARANVIILRYMAIVILATVFMLGALGVSYTVLESTMASADSLIESNDVKADVFSDTKEEVRALGAQLDNARIILDQETRFSNVLVQLGQAMPAGTVIGEITLTPENFNGTPATVTAYATSSAEADTLASQLQTSPLINSVTVQSTEATGGSEQYPAVVVLGISFNRAGL